MTRVQELITGYLDGAIAPADLVLRYRIGSPTTDETALELHGDGRYDAFSTATAGGRRLAYSGEVSAADARAVIAALAHARVWEARHVERHQPKGDAPARLSVAAGGRVAEVELWTSEIADVPQFAAAQDAVLALIRDISGGAVLEPGR